jgi:hypothetical protein
MLWDITMFSPLRVNRRFRGTRHLHVTCHLLYANFLLGSFFALKMKVTCSSETLVDFHESRCFHTCLFLGLFDPEIWRDVSPKRRSNFNGQHDVISQRILLYSNFVSLIKNPHYGYLRTINERNFCPWDGVKTVHKYTYWGHTQFLAFT